MNQLFYGDCLTIMLNMPMASVDLIYLDPPFNSQRQYNSIYRDETGRPLPDQIDAFNDMWELDPARERAIRTIPGLMRESGIDYTTAKFWQLWMNALRKTQPRLLAYLSYMAERLLIMHRILKSTGSLYLHCDPTASHYVKALLDAIFGHHNFRNEIVWKRTGAHNAAKRWGPIHDTLLFYSKTDRYIWNRVSQRYSDAYLDSAYQYTDDRGRYRLSEITGPGTRQGQSGQPWRNVDPTERGRHWAVPPLPQRFDRPEGYERMSVQERLDLLDSLGMIAWPKSGVMPRFKRYLDLSKGVSIQSVISDIPPISGTGKERLGYATQKPLALMERIIMASSNPGDVVLDPFCGCASTLEAAHQLDREWIGIDVAFHCINRVIRQRLKERLGLEEGKDFTVAGVPGTVEAAQDLWNRDKYHFQQWAVEMVEGFVTSKRTADGGVDGRLYFEADGKPSLQSMAIEVKGGRHVSITDLRALKGVLDYENALMAGLIVLHPLGVQKTRNFNQFIANAGELKIGPVHYPKIQILTVEEILEGTRFYTPWVVGRHELQPRMPGMPR